MKNLSPQVELVNQIISNGHKAGVLQVRIQNSKVNGRSVTVDGKEKVYFGNCSYLGLENDERIKDAAIEAIRNYGTYFSCSRTYVEVPLFEELEYLFFQMFGKPCTIAPTTTLGHMSNIPILIRPEDAVILDHQVHASIQNAVQIVKANGTHVEIMRHGRMDMLESRIKKLKDKHDRIWFMTDGVYSMYGDVAPMDELHELMDRYEQLWCYVDDAHGMSWTGHNGTGFALSKMPTFHDRMIFIASLAKGFGVCGAVLVYPNRETREIVKNCGSTLVFSGPPQPVTLGASIASCKIHLSNEIYERQEKLADLMRYYVLTAKALGLPLVSEVKTPIFFIGVGTPETGYEITKRMLDSGYLLNLSVFPAVPYKNTGLRTTLNTNLSIQDIYDMLSTLANHLEDMEKKQKVNKQEIFKAFALAY
jgi:7-keto-8-aminopelargonate synthetase-like enzyme